MQLPSLSGELVCAARILLASDNYLLEAQKAMMYYSERVLPAFVTFRPPNNRSGAECSASLAQPLPSLPVPWFGTVAEKAARLLGGVIWRARITTGNERENKSRKMWR